MVAAAGLTSFHSAARALIGLSPTGVLPLASRL